MRYIFAEQDRAFQIKRIREGIDEYREAGKADRAHFQMHPVYDDLLSQITDHFLGYWKSNVALVALGGYGRREMSPYSDIDILFLRPENAPEGIYRGVRNVLYLLWDAKVELGHSVRTVKECLTEADNDLAVLTSLMDVRFVWGSEALFRELVGRRESMIVETDPLDLYLRIEAEIRKSSEKFSSTIYMLEPHLKEGPGSLRYIQLIAWLAKIIFGCAVLDDLAVAGICSKDAVEEARAGMAFLAELRTGLHFLAGRRDDRLKFEAQLALANQMGFVDTPDRRGVESFMREYYRQASSLDFFGRRVLDRARLFLRPKIASDIKRLALDESFYVGSGGINHTSPESLAEDGNKILTAFVKVAETGCELDIRLVDIIRESFGTINTDVITDKGANRIFLSILEHSGSVAVALNSMMKIGVLERFIPEFAWIRFLPQHDVYHQFTVDLHTMAVLKNIDAFASDRGGEDHLLATIFSRLEDTKVLYLAALFHDIAKGMGAGHEVRGEEISRNVLRRLGLSESHVSEVGFLIRNHLAMTHLAFKKDLHDEAMLSRFSENVATKRRLDLLLLLTHADLRAVGPTAFNSWRRMLLEELYYRALDVIEGEGPDGSDLATWVSEIKSVVRDLVPEKLSVTNAGRLLGKCRDTLLPGFLSRRHSRAVHRPCRLPIGK